MSTERGAGLAPRPLWYVRLWHVVLAQLFAASGNTSSFVRGRWASVRYLISEELFALDRAFGWGRGGGTEAGDFTLDFGAFTSGRKTATLLDIYLFPYLEIKMNAAGEDNDPPGPVVSGVARTGQCRPPSSQSMTCFPGITRLGWRHKGAERPAGNTGGDIMFSHESKNVLESILGRPGVSQGATLGDPEFLGLQPWGGLGFLGCCLAASGQAGLVPFAWGLGTTARSPGRHETNTPVSVARCGQWRLPAGRFRGHSSALCGKVGIYLSSF